MAWQHTIYAYPMLFAMAISLVLGAYAVVHSRQHGHTTTLRIFAAMNVAVAIWTGFSAIKLLSRDPTIQFHTYRLLYIGSASIGPLLLLFALAYTDRTRWLRRRFIVAVFVVPVTFLVLLFTNPHGVVIVETHVVEVDGLLVMRTTTGPAHVALSFTYALTIAVLTLGIVGYEALRLGRSYLPQASLMGIAIVTPMTVSFLTSANVPPFTVDAVNFVPASAAISSIALGIATFRYRLLDLPPIAYTTAMRHSPDGVFVLDPDETIVHANETASRLLGLSSSVVGEPIASVLPDVDPEAAAERPLERSSAAGSAEFLTVRSQPLERHGERVGWVLVLRDVTEQRRRERELEAFTGVVSHDLREPLRTTESYLQLLEEHTGNALDEDGAELLTVARENTDRMQEMVTDLLRYSQIGSAESEFQPVDCEEVVADTLDALRYEIDDRDAAVVVEDLPTVHGVEHLLGRLFQNLLSNALKHSDSDSPEIRVTSSRVPGGWQFSIRDDGPGIDPEELDHVFELFTRGSGTDPDSGTGMGLAICKKIVEEHGGTIGVDSTVGIGTEISFTIPGETD